MHEDIYTSGDYLQKNPGWHAEESPWKAQQVMRAMTQNQIIAKTICEVGCGTGNILKQLQGTMDSNCLFWGYDISPQALELARDKTNDRLHFKLGDITQEKDTFFDLILVMDVIEHLENYFSFLRDIKSKSEYKIFHIPLDLSVQTLLRHNGLIKVRNAYGHIHYFTKDIVLKMLEEMNYEILDYSYTSSSIELPTHEITRKLLRLPRKLSFSIHKDLAARLLGGFRLLVLAK